MIVEDHTMMAQVLGLSLGAQGFTCEVAVLDSVESICRQAADFQPQTILLDLHLNGLDGLTLVGPLSGTGARVLVVSGARDEARLAAAVTLGAFGWVRKSEPFERLLQAVVDTAEGRQLLPSDKIDDVRAAGQQHLATERDLSSRLGRLTSREREVLASLSAGRTVQEIAQEMYVSIATIRSHVRAILNKLEVSTQLAAVALARSLESTS